MCCIASFIISDQTSAQVFVWGNTGNTRYIVETGRCVHREDGVLGRALKIDLFGEREVVG